MKTTLFLINAVLCFTIGVSFASEPLLEEINKNQIIPRLDSLALSNYALTNTTNSMAVRAYKTENKIYQNALIHCPSSTEMMSILSNDRRIAGMNIFCDRFKDLRTDMEWKILLIPLIYNPSTESLITELSGYKLKEIRVSKDQLECEYRGKNIDHRLRLGRPLKTSKRSLILNAEAPLNQDYLAFIRVTGDPKDYLTLELNNPYQYYTPLGAPKLLLPEDAEEGIDLVFDQAQ
jgi:hypothetical protein